MTNKDIIARALASNIKTRQMATSNVAEDGKILQAKNDGTFEWVNIGYDDFDVFDEFTRPNNTTSYSVGDIYTDSTTASIPLIFENVARENGGSCVLTDIRITIDSSRDVVPLFRIYIFNQPPNLPNDGTTMNLSIEDANSVQFKENSINSIKNDITTIITVSNLSALLQADGNSRNLYGALELLNDYSPASQETARVNLRGYLLD